MTRIAGSPFARRVKSLDEPLPPKAPPAPPPVPKVRPSPARPKPPPAPEPPPEAPPQPQPAPAPAPNAVKAPGSSPAPKAGEPPPEAAGAPPSSPPTRETATPAPAPGGKATRPPKTPKFKLTAGEEGELKGYAVRFLDGKQYGLYSTEEEAKQAAEQLSEEPHDYSPVEVWGDPSPTQGAAPAKLSPKDFASAGAYVRAVTQAALDHPGGTSTGQLKQTMDAAKQEWDATQKAAAKFGEEFSIPSTEVQQQAYQDGYLLHATKKAVLENIAKNGLGTAWFSSTDQDAGDQPGEVLLALHRSRVPETDQYGDPSISKSSGYFINDPELGDKPIPAADLMIFKDGRMVPLLEAIEDSEKPPMPDTTASGAPKPSPEEAQALLEGVTIKNFSERADQLSLLTGDELKQLQSQLGLSSETTTLLLNEARRQLREARLGAGAKQDNTPEDQNFEETYEDWASMDYVQSIAKDLEYVVRSGDAYGLEGTIEYGRTRIGRTNPGFYEKLVDGVLSKARITEPFDIDKHPSLVAMGEDGLKVEGGLDSWTVNKHLSHLAKLPASLTEKMKAHAVTVFVSNTTIPNMDNKRHLAGVTPRGWEGATWDVVAGGYTVGEGKVLAGAGEYDSASLALHEYGHAVGDKLNYNTSPELLKAHKRLYDNLDPYLQQGGPGGLAGREELLAEGFATVIMDRDEALRLYDKEFVAFIEGILGNPAPAARSKYRINTAED